MNFGNDDGRSPFEQSAHSFFSRLQEGKLPPGSGFLVIGVVVLLLVIFATGGSFYSVRTEETAVVLRLGRYLCTNGPGLHFKLPFGIDYVEFVPTGRISKQEFGFRTSRTTTRSEYADESFDAESLTLTGDLNVVDVEWIVQYQISDPYKFVFRIEDPTSGIRDMSEAVVRRVLGGLDVNKILSDRSIIAVQIHQELQKLLDSYDIGIKVMTVEFQEVNPPGPVKDAFNDVNEAEQQKAALIFQAREQYNKEVPHARGVASQTIAAAEGYAMERLNRAKGETQRFLDLLAEYHKAPEVTKQRLYLETIEEVLPRMREFYVLDTKDGAGMQFLPHLPLRGTEQGVTP